MSAGGPGPLELWVGAECTINRVGDRWRDQGNLTGFTHRLDDDLDRLGSLGARRVRLPLLWERVESVPGTLDFAWTDRAVARALAAGLQPIAGLLHHGSGPRHTSLVDPDFPSRFADYARRVAERYPALDAWTPINEPLTTARFSCLYGLWYPHAADDRSFVRALLNQVQATALAMRAIRAVNPRAQLVQTDDLGFTRSTPALAALAAFDNERRWLAFDLLCGRVDRHHPLWDWLRGHGAGEAALAALREAPCPPDILGINAYVTSERFLDERLELHPAHLHGGNGRQAYVDIETVRAHGALIDGFAGRLREAHARYGLPLAITEVHMGCTREEQLRWLHQAWRAAEQARAEGVDVRALTAWAAFGTVDWRSLLTRDEGHYEPGLWDVRSDPPRMTALGRLAAALARTESRPAAALHPVLDGPGWWQRDLRLGVPPHGAVAALPAGGAPLLIVGRGALARAFARLAHMRGLPHDTLAGFDASDAGCLRELLAVQACWAVVDAQTDDETGAARRDHRRQALETACAHAAVRLAIVRDRLEGSAIAPGTLVILAEEGSDPSAGDDVVSLGLALLARGDHWTPRRGGLVSPTCLPDLVQAALDLLIDGEQGEWQLTAAESPRHAAFARRAALPAGHGDAIIDGGAQARRVAASPGSPRRLGR